MQQDEGCHSAFRNGMQMIQLVREKAVKGST